MTSNPSSNQWLRTATPTFVKPLPPSVSPDFKRAPRSYPRQSVAEANALSASSSNAAQPLTKRQKVLEGPSRSPSEPCNESTVQTSAAASNASIKPTSEEQARESLLRQEVSTSSQNSHQISRSKSLLVPLRPGKKPTITGPRRINSSAALRGGFKGNVQNKPYVVESPPSAPRFRNHGTFIRYPERTTTNTKRLIPGTECADFHPWTGHHPEDILNESTTKNGSYDKPQASQNEVSTAKHAIWSSLKHKSGSQVLSSLFVSALDQRQAHGAVTANCTFKPPPRVTLTDTKREAWLRDLANPDIPLRRLSRTIPHGVRGKVLLDQCLAKEVPTSRAVWLAQCVGANEIRAFKRKGAGGAFAIGGESKWIKDWTSSVEQFIEAIIGTCGSLDWRCRIDYGLRLASHLSLEHLLDREHYLAWALSSLQSCDLDNLPVWLLVMQIHRDELLQQRQRGRHLVEALFTQLHKIYHVLTASAKAVDIPADEIYQSLVRQLTGLLSSIMISHPRLFLMPRLWHKYEPIFRQCMDDEEKSELHACLERISMRNQRLLMKMSENQAWKPPSTPRQRLILTLDNLPANSNFSGLAKDCLHTVSDFDILVATCLEWASSLHRNGRDKIYICSRLLRQCSNAHSGLEASIMRFLAADSSSLGSFSDNMYRVLAELLRTKHIAPGRYLSWLIARGNLSNFSSTDQRRSRDARLLLEMPLQGVPSHVQNLRQILLARIGTSVKDEDEEITFQEAQLSEKMPDLFSTPLRSPTSRRPLDDIARCSVRIKHAIASWIRANVATYFPMPLLEHNAKRKGLASHQSKTNDSTLKPITVDQVQTICDALQDLGDFVTFGDVLRIISYYADQPVLAVICDTVNRHLDIFDAIGIHAGLFYHVHERYRALRQTKNMDLSLIESLIDLGKSVPDSAQKVKHLGQQALQYQQNSSAIACSPISDNMAEALQITESDSVEDIEQVLASGTSMDETTQYRLFETIVKRLEASWISSTLSLTGFCELLTRLRRFGRKNFDNLVHKWVRHVLRKPAYPEVRKVLIPLICSGCLTLVNFLELATSTLEESSLVIPREALSMEVIEMLAFIESDKALAMVQKGYRARLEYSRVVRRRPIAVVPFLHAILQATLGSNGQTNTQRHPEIHTLLSDIAVCSPHTFVQLGRVVGATTLFSHYYMHIRSEDVANFDGPSDNNLTSLGPAQGDIEWQLMQVLNRVNDFNLPLCRLRLEEVLAEAVSSAENPALIIIAVLKTMCPTSAPPKALLSSLFAGLPSNHALQVRRHMESEIISGIPYNQRLLDRQTRVFVESLLQIIEVNVDESFDQAMFSAVVKIGETLNHLISTQRFVVEQPNPDGLGAPTDNDGGDSIAGDSYDVHVLLRLLVAHQLTTQHPRFPQTTIYSIVMSLSLLLIHPSLSEQTGLTHYLYDVLTLLSDFLNEDGRARCIATLRNGNSILDPRIHLIFGFPDFLEEGWLRCVTDSSIASETGAPDGSVEASKPATQPFSLRRWEMMQDATPLLGENDASLSLTLFGARRSVL